MTVNYTTNLSLGQPVTGTESGTWGDDVNNSVTSYLDIAIAGGLAITITTTDVTLTLTQGTSSATNIGSTTAQYAILNVSGAMTAARNLILPSSSRQYVINNNTTGGFALTVKGSATSGVTMVNGEKAHVFWNGSDYAKLSNTPGGAGTFSSITNTGLTSGRVVYSTTGGLETDSAGLTFDGTNFATTGTATATKLIPTGTSVTGNGLYLPAANALGLSTNGTNAVYIDSSQNVGIGTSSPTAITGYKTLALNGSTGGIIYLMNNGSNFGYLYNDTTNIHLGTSGATVLSFDTNATERMRIDSSGNVGIGTTPSASTLPTIQSTYGVLSGNTNINIVNNAYYSSGWKYFGTGLAAQYQQDTGKHLWFNAPSGTAGNAITFTQAMTLDASGNLLVGTTSVLSNGRIVIGSPMASINGLTVQSTSTSGTATYAYFLYNGTGTGAIQSTGTLTTYGTTSDYRLKTVVGAVTDAGQRIDALQPVEYTWNSSGQRTRGFLAHQFQEVYADSVTGTKDAVDDNGNPEYQSMQAGTSEVIADLVAEIQSLRKRLTALEST